MPDGLPDPGKIWNDFITNPLVQTAGTLPARGDDVNWGEPSVPPASVSG